MYICSSHPRAPAAWVCTQCGKNLCEDCAASQIMQSGRLVRCTSCRGVAELLMRQKDITPYWGLMHVFFLNMFKPERLLTLVMLSGALAVLSWLASLAGLAAIFVLLFYLGVYASYYFLVIRNAADGQLVLPEAADFSDLFDVLGAAIRFIAAMAIMWLPAIIYIYFAYGLRMFLAYPHLDPVLIIMLILGLLYAPGAIITAAISENTGAMFNPMNVLGIAARIPSQYLATAVAWIVLTVIQIVINGLLKVLFYKLAIPYAGAWLNETLSLILPLLGAFMLGRLIYQNGQTLEYIAARDMVEPVFPQAVPRHEFRVEDAEQVRSRGPVAPIELSPEVMATPASATATAMAGPMTVTAPNGGQADPAALTGGLAAALAAGDQDAALLALDALVARAAPIDLDPRQELRLAGMLERAGRHLEAAKACRRAADRDRRGPLACRAIFTAGRLLIDKAGNPDQGAAMLRYLVANFPQDELSLRAAEMLRRLE